LSSKSAITNRVRELRVLHDQMSQAALGKSVGVTRQTVIAIEQNRYSPSLETAFRISRVFGLTVEEVFQTAVTLWASSAHRSIIDQHSISGLLVDAGMQNDIMLRARLIGQRREFIHVDLTVGCFCVQRILPCPVSRHIGL